MMTTRPPKTIVKPTALGPVANTDTKLLIYGLFQKRPSFGTGRGPRPSRNSPRPLAESRPHYTGSFQSPSCLKKRMEPERLPADAGLNPESPDARRATLSRASSGPGERFLGAAQ